MRRWPYYVFEFGARIFEYGVLLSFHFGFVCRFYLLCVLISHFVEQMGLEECDGNQSGHCLNNDSPISRYWNIYRSEDEGTERSSENDGALVFPLTLSTKPMENFKMRRIETVKQLFHAHVNRQQAYDFPHAIGLMTFDKDITYVILWSKNMQKLTFPQVRCSSDSYV